VIVAGRTHYGVLGVSPAASSAEIREAYRRLAREHHPDRRRAGSAAGADRMHDINEAYRVLIDPGRRALYDTELRNRTSSSSTSSSTSRPPGSRSGSTTTDAGGTAGGSAPGYVYTRPYEPARVPWRTLLVAGAIAIVGILVIAQFTDPGEEPLPDGILRVGDCVMFEADDDAREVRCTGEEDLVIRAFVTFDGTCPGLTEPHRDQLGMGVACVDVGR
jgi:molecular chaperone DnaJ